MATRHYIRTWYPGLIVAERSERKVETRDVGAAIKSLDASAYAFQFYDREEIERDGKVLVGPIENESETYFPGGCAMTVEDVERTYPHESILLSNMRCNDMKSVIRHRRGGFVDAKNAVIC